MSWDEIKRTRDDSMNDFIWIEQPTIEGIWKEEKKQKVLCHLPGSRRLTLLELDGEQENRITSETIHRITDDSMRDIV